MEFHIGDVTAWIGSSGAARVLAWT